MKISNETKVGALTAIAITVLILGFNYLKGKNITQQNRVLYATFPNVEGLTLSNPVVINGLPVGRVADMKEKDRNMTGIIVTLSVRNNINIPENSVAYIDKSLLSTTTLKIRLGNADNYIKDGDTLQTQENPDLFAQVKTSVNPAIDNINKTLQALQTLIMKVSALVDPYAKSNLQNILANLNASSQSLKQMLAADGSLGKTMNNVAAITDNFSKNNDKINHTLDNLEKTSGELANAPISETVTTLKQTLATLETTLSKVNSKEGTLGLLLNDPQLYQEIRQTNRSLNTLLDDLRLHPKRYVNISVFGKKDKSGPLMNPVYDSVSKHANQ